MRYFYLPAILFGLFATPVFAETGMHFSEIAPGLYLRPGVQAVSDANNEGRIANLGFVVGEQRVAVIDAGGSYAEGLAVLQAIRAITDKPIQWLIVTHMHPDHSLGAAAFADQGIEIIGHANLADALNRRRDAYVNPVKDYLGPQAEGTRIVLPNTDVSVGQPRRLDLGARVLTLQAHPTAHTNNDLTVYDEQTGALWLADLLFVDHIPVVDGSVLGWQRVMQSLAEQTPTMIVPGHGAVQAHWQPALDSQKRYLQAVADGARRIIRRGGDISEAVDVVAQDERRHWLLFDDFHGRNVTAIFAELEWE